MPEIAISYGVGCLVYVLCASATMAYWRWDRNKGKHGIVKINLRKVDLFWSENSNEVLPWTQTLEESDERASLRSILVTFGVLFPFSWAGLIFLAIVMTSYFVLARSRLEKKLFSSGLALDLNLSVDAIQAELARIMA